MPADRAFDSCVPNNTPHSTYFAQSDRGAKKIAYFRTRAASDELRRQKRRFSGRAPYGWCYLENGTMVEVPQEQETLEIIRQLSGEGLSLNEIGTQLETLGRRPRSAKKWHPKVLASLRKVA